jgi:hypothetical protein
MLLALWAGGAGLLLLSVGEFDPVLGAYSYGVSAVSKQDCATRVLQQVPQQRL